MPPNDTPKEALAEAKERLVKRASQRMEEEDVKKGSSWAEMPRSYTLMKMKAKLDSIIAQDSVKTMMSTTLDDCADFFNYLSMYVEKVLREGKVLLVQRDPKTGKLREDQL